MSCVSYARSHWMARSFGRDRRDQPAELAGHQVLERPRRDRIVGGEVGLEPVQRAGREREPDLEPEVGRDNPLRAQCAEHPVARDRIVDARPGIPPQLGDAGGDAEHRRFVGVPRDPGRRFGLLDHDHAGVRPDEPFPLIADPCGPGARLAVGQREHQIAEEPRRSAQGRIGRVGRQASNQQQVTAYSGRHRVPSSRPPLITVDPRCGILMVESWSLLAVGLVLTYASRLRNR